MSEEQEIGRNLARIRKEWFAVVKDAGRIEQFGGAYYFFGSELETLRQLARYRLCKAARQGFSSNMGTHYFCLEVETSDGGRASTMTTAEARLVFDNVAAGATDPDARANIEFCREYFTNPDFRRALANTVKAINGLLSA